MVMVVVMQWKLIVEVTDGGHHAFEKVGGSGIV